MKPDDLIWVSERSWPDGPACVYPITVQGFIDKVVRQAKAVPRLSIPPRRGDAKGGVDLEWEESGDNLPFEILSLDEVKERSPYDWELGEDPLVNEMTEDDVAVNLCAADRGMFQVRDRKTEYPTTDELFSACLDFEANELHSIDFVEAKDFYAGWGFDGAEEKSPQTP